MRIFKKLLIITTATSIIAGFYGCASSMINERKGSDKVSLLEASQVDGCLSKGSTTVSVLAAVGFISRSDEAVEANLLQLARNSAIDAGGDAVVKGI
jgi:hypothetical protein